MSQGNGFRRLCPMLLALAPAAPLCGQYKAWVWQDRPGTPLGTTHTPSLTYQYNSSGLGAITIRHAEVGRYAVNIPGLEGLGSHVTAFGGNHVCAQPSGGDVHCWDPSSGTPVDGGFVLLRYKDVAPDPSRAWGWARIGPTLWSRTEQSRGVGAFGGEVSDGNFVTFLALKPTSGGTVLAGSSGPTGGNEACHVKSWTTGALTGDLRVDFGCPGTPYSTVAIGFWSDTNVGGFRDHGGYTFAGHPGMISYTPAATYTANTAGAVRIDRLGTGRYLVNYFGQRSGTEPTVALATAYQGSHCNIGGWNNLIGPVSFSTVGVVGVSVAVNCFDPTGVAADSAFTSQFLTSRLLGSLTTVPGGSPDVIFK